jgi:hypothetical protein
LQTYKPPGINVLFNLGQRISVYAFSIL